MKYYLIIGLFYVSGLTSACLWGYELYKTFKCENIPQYSCRNDKCLIKGHCDKYRFSDAEREKIKNLLEKMD